MILAEELADLQATPRGSRRRLVDGGDLAMLLYTSGTTGKSKGAEITHDNVLATVTGLLAAWAWEPADALLLTLPLFHTHGLVVGLHCALAAGATVLLRPPLRRRRGRRRAARRASRRSSSASPPCTGGWSRSCGAPERASRLDLSRLRLFCSGSAPLSAETFAAFRELTGHEILERYGMTETGMNLSNPYAGTRRPGTVGAPLPGVSIRIVDGEGGTCRRPARGSCWCAARTSSPATGGRRRRRRRASSMTHLGRRWFRTGDLARRDPETGAVTLLGRRHELIISGGFNVYPREVEEVLAGFPGVREAAVVGRPHPDWGEVPVAFLVADPGLDEAALIAFCKSQMAGFKVPREIRRVDSLPRNALGKVEKHRLPA